MKWILKGILLSCVLSLVLFILAIFCSPYQFDKATQTSKMIEQIQINKSCKNAFIFLGNSNNAPKWSVYVSSIKTINSIDFQDGSVGSKRICYAIDSEFSWEEEILAVTENKYRKLSCYNYQNLWFKAPLLETEQIYIPTKEGCQLALTLHSAKADISLLEYVKLKLGSYIVANIFSKNIKNIQRVLNNNTYEKRSKSIF